MVVNVVYRGKALTAPHNNTHSPVEGYRRGSRDRTTYVITTQIVLKTEQRESRWTWRHDRRNKGKQTWEQ